MFLSVDLGAALDAVTGHGSPRVVGRVDDRYAEVAGVLGERVW